MIHHHGRTPREGVPLKSVLLLCLVFFQAPATAQIFRNTISGQILGMDSKPASGVRVAVVPVHEGETFSPLWSANQTATTDSRGNFILRDVDPGQYYLLAGQLDAPTYFPGAKEVAQARKIAIDRTVLEKQDFRLVQSPGVDIRGRLASNRRIGSPPSILLWRRDTRIWPRVETPIRADGSFVFHGVPPGVYDLSLGLYGGALLNGTEIHVKDKHVSIRLVEVPAAGARGRVEIEGGGTIPQVTVEFKNGAGRFLAGIRTLVEEKDTGTLMFPAGEYRVSFAQFPADYRVVSFTYGDMDLLKGSVKVAGSLETFKLKLARVQPSKLRRISGRVLGVEHVSTPSFVGLSNSSFAYPVLARASLQSDGRYEFTGLTAGTYTLWIGERVYESLPRTVTLGETDIDDVDFNIPALRQLQGRIVLNGGGALPNFGVVFVHETGVSRYASRKADGAFTAIVPDGDWTVRLDNLPQDAFQVQSMMFGNSDLLRSPLRIEGSNLPELRITLAPLRTGTNAAEVAKDSRIAASSLQPIGVTVDVEGDFPKPRASLEFERISPDGMGDLYFTNEYFKTSLPPGDYKVRVKGFPKDFFRLKSLDAGSMDLLRERLHVSEGFNPQIILTFAGIVNAPWGRIRGRIAVEAQSWGAHLIGQGEDGKSPADSSGHFEFTRVLPGSYWVNSTSVVGAGASRVLVADNKTPSADVTLPAVREIRGRVVVDGGNPLPYAVVQVSGPSLERPIESVVDADGAFQMTVPDGEHDVQVINLSAPYRTKSIRWGSVDLVGDKFRLASATEDEVVATLDVIPTALWPSVSGDVVGVAGLPASAKIALVGGANRLFVRTTMNRNGGFSFPRVPPDIYTLRLDPPIYGMPDRTVVVEDRDVRAPDLVVPEQRMITTRVRVDGDAQKLRFTLVLKGSDGKGFQFLYLGSNLLIPLGRTDFECIGDVCGNARLGAFLNEPSVVSDNSPETFWLRIPDGEYRLELRGGPALRSVTYGAVDLLKDSLRLSSANPAEIVITFAP